ncbi:hypothetical protein RI367_000716 [Sorochytrium milnesiophthora]
MPNDVNGDTPATAYVVRQIPPPGSALPLDSPSRDPRHRGEAAINKPVPKLFAPLKLRGVTFNNRVAVSPMCMYSTQDGFATDFHLVHIGQYALRGAGLVVMEAAAVSPEGRISPHDLGIWKDGHIAPLKRVVDFVHSQGGHIGIQLAHAGRKASTLPPFTQSNAGRMLAEEADGGWPKETLAPSAVAWSQAMAHPLALTREQIAELVKSFAQAARRAHQAGFDVVEIHGAHGYLIHEFLSPTSNERTDEYGGSLENRGRFLREVVTAVRKEWPEDKPVFLRLSCTDWVETSSWNINECIATVRDVLPLGVDLIDASSGGAHPAQQIKTGQHFQVPFAAAIKKATGAVTGAVGLIVNSAEAEAVLQNGEADVIFLGREFLRNPNWVLKAAHELDAPVKWPSQYERAKF